MNQYSEKNQPKIFISGDSWGCGEWGLADWASDNPKAYGVTHSGLEQYFLNLGYEVINCSKGDSSNFESINRLKESLVDYSNGDFVFWIQSDCLRDLRPFVRLTQDILDADGVDNLCTKLLNSTYTKLNSLGIPIYCIGGPHDLNLTEMGKFKNLIPLVPSWVYLLVGHFKEYKNLFPHHIIHHKLIDHIDIDLYTIDFKQKVVNELFHRLSCWRLYKELIFHPDGAHPNRYGHKILFDYIVKELKI